MLRDLQYKDAEIRSGIMRQYGVYTYHMTLSYLLFYSDASEQHFSLSKKMIISHLNDLMDISRTDK